MYYIMNDPGLLSRNRILVGKMMVDIDVIMKLSIENQQISSMIFYNLVISYFCLLIIC
jgi:hypothetical protein